MDLRGKKVTLHDMSLRDGMHAKRHQITLDQMVRVACALDEAKMPLIEITHGDGLGGASINYGFGLHTDREYLEAVIPKLQHSKVSALSLPGIGTVDELKMAVDCGVSTIRSPHTAQRQTSLCSTSVSRGSSASTRSAS